MILFTLLLSKLICFTASETFTMTKAHQNNTCALVRKNGHQMHRVLCHRETVILGKIRLKQIHNKESLSLFLHLLSFSLVPLSIPCLLYPLQPSILEKHGTEKAAPLTCFH